jgi:WD40 repeat protein/tRNA A-37 threonylcarbamoyl transferase component Bud32
MKLNSPETTDPCVDAIVAEYLDQLDRGVAPTRAALLLQHPEYVEELGEFLDDLESFSPSHNNANCGNAAVAMAAQHLDSPSPMGGQRALEDTMAGLAHLPSISLLGVSPGKTFGDYELIDVIARGGMGIIFKARQKKLDRVVALKMILAGQLASEQDIQRFQSEAQAAARLDHPGIVPVYEVGEQDGLHYFTMALIEGQSLDERLRDGPLQPMLAAQLVRDLAGTLQYAHQQGIVHRDLKPGNVMIDQQGRPKLTDFGLAKRIEDARDMTGTGQILGTPTYMSPEQADCGVQTIGPASDIYGLGALLFALLTGRPPFQAATPLETIRHVQSMEPPRPRALNPGVPGDLETLCLKCLEKSPGKRYATAAALAEEIDRYLNDLPILARPAGRLEKALRWYRRRPVIGTMAVAIALLTVAVPVLLAGLLQEADARAQVEATGHRDEAAAHMKETEARQRIEALDRERTRELFHAYVNEAAARRLSPHVGRRFQSLDRIAAARDLANELKLPQGDYVRLRSEAISALSLTDMRGATTGPGWEFAVDPFLFRYVTKTDCYLDWDRSSGLSPDRPTDLFVRRLGDNSIVQRIPDLQPDRGLLELSADNRFVSLVLDGRLRIWQVNGAAPKEIIYLDKVHSAVFSPTRPEAIVLTPQSEIVIKPLDGTSKSRTLKIAKIQKEPLPGFGSCLAASSRRLAVAGDDHVSIVDLDSGKLASACSLPGEVNTMAWSPDGKMLAVSCGAYGRWECSIVFYEPASQTRRVVEGPAGGAMNVKFDPTGRYLLSWSSWGARAILWDTADGSAVLRFHISELASKTQASEGVPRFGWWQAELDTPYQCMSSYLPDGVDIGKIGESAVHPGGRLLATVTEAGIALGDLATARRIAFLPVGSGTNLRFDSAGNLFGYIKNQPHRWQITREGDRYKIAAPERLNMPAQYTCLNISPDGRFIAQPMGNAGSIVLDRKTAKSTSLQPQYDVRCAIVHPQGLYAASFGWSTKGFRFWDLATGRLINASDQGTMGSGKFTSDGRYLVTRAVGISDILLWSVPDCKVVRHLGTEAEFAISGDSRYLAAAEPGGKVRLNRIDTGEMIARFDVPGEEYIVLVYFSPDGHYLVGANIGGTKQHIWDLWKLRRQLGELHLDWETTPVPAADANPVPITVEIAEAAKMMPAGKP